MLIGTDGKPLYNKVEPKIVAVVCVWDQMYPHVVEDLLRLFGSGVIHGYIMATSTLLPSCRNLGTAQALEKFPEATHILYVDQDMYNLTPAHIVRLVNHNVDVVSPLMVQRKPPYKPAAQALDMTNQSILESIKTNKLGLIECLHVGTGVMLVKREVLERTREMVGPKGDGQVWFSMDRLFLEDVFHDMIVKECGETITTSNKLHINKLAKAVRKAYRRFDLMGEDVYFCFKCRDLGIKCFVDTGCHIAHIGLEGKHVLHWLKQLMLEQEENDKREQAAKPGIVSATTEVTTPVVAG